MKKLTLIFAVALFVTVTAANAQNPTTDTSRTQRQSTQKNSKSSDQMSKDRDQGSNRHNEGTLVRSSDVPASLRQTLQGSEYNGWENGQVYKTKNGYSVEIRKNGMVKTHRFDANGQPIKDNKDKDNK
jgi:hypothetical protein